MQKVAGLNLINFTTFVPLQHRGVGPDAYNYSNLIIITLMNLPFSDVYFQQFVL